jgi:serine/threonine protein kinase/Tfp pilus assembly protein PilF
MLLHYRLVVKIGQGGMGVVWRAVDTTLDRDVAIKILPDEFAADTTRLARFEREAKILASLNHPEIASIYSLHEAEGLRFLAMEFVEGEVLTRHIPEDGAPFDELVAIALPLSDAVALAHERGITHRDLKPDNVMITTAGRVKVLDFGLAKLVDRSALKDDTQAATATVVTGEGKILGSVAYMSPEQVEGKAVDSCSDVFSLGIVLYEMATGKRPFRGSTPISTLSAILRDAPPSVNSVRGSFPPKLDAIISRCLEKDPRQRFRDAGELRDELRKLQRDEGKIVLNNRPLRIAGVVVGLLVSAIAVIVLWPSTDRDVLPTRLEAETVLSRGPSIAVLPFENASGDPDRDYFSGGLTQEIITELTRFPDLFVIARDSTSKYKGDTADVRKVSADLGGVRYVLRGSVRNVGDTIRVTAELSDTRDGAQLWRESYTRDLTASDLFSLQDELTQQVVNAIAGSYGAISRAGLAEARRNPPNNLDSYDCILRTYEYLHAHFAPEHLAARDCLERAVELDPSYPDAWAWLAYTYAEEQRHQWNLRPESYDALDRALEASEHAVRLDPANQVSHGALALTYFQRGEFDRFRVEADRAIARNPNNALWLAYFGTRFCDLDECDRGIPMVRKALALNPNPPSWYYIGLFFDHYRNDRYEAALAEAQKYEGGDYRPFLFRAAAYAQLGRLAEARREVAAMQALGPELPDDMRRDLMGHHGYAPGLTDHLLEGLRKAGLVESEPAIVGE